jgi:hypothetical protein
MEVVSNTQNNRDTKSALSLGIGGVSSSPSTSTSPQHHHLQDQHYPHSNLCRSEPSNSFVEPHVHTCAWGFEIVLWLMAPNYMDTDSLGLQV